MWRILLIVIAPKPKPDLLLVDALLVEARKQGITPVLVINKSDLDRSFCEKTRDEYAQSGDRVLITSSKKTAGISGAGYAFANRYMLLCRAKRRRQKLLGFSRYRIAACDRGYQQENVPGQAYHTTCGIDDPRRLSGAGYSGLQPAVADRS